MLAVVYQHFNKEQRLCFFEGLTRTGRFIVVFLLFWNESFAFLIIPERPVSIQKRYGSTAWKPAMVGRVGSVSQSNALFTNN